MGFNLLTLMLPLALAGGPQKPTPAPVSTPAPTPTFTLVTLGEIGPSVDAKTVQASLDLLNGIFQNGCFEKALSTWSIPYRTRADGSTFASKQAALDVLKANAPYRLDIRWYRESSNVMGYTYNWLMKPNGQTDSSKSETRIWTNRNIVTGPKTYASHLMHELSHQWRAGGAVHWTKFDGTLPYSYGDIAYYCLTGEKR